MKIDDEVFVHGYVDEIRTDVVIIRNHGGYFGTVKAEILSGTQPERKTGRWIYDSEAYPLGNPYGHYDCDQCGESVPNRTNFCPNCGAKMEAENRC